MRICQMIGSLFSTFIMVATDILLKLVPIFEKTTKTL